MQILIDGVDIREYNVHWLSKQIGCVTSDIDLYQVSIADNIRSGFKNISHEEIRLACKQVDLDNFIQSLPFVSWVQYESIIYT